MNEYIIIRTKNNEEANCIKRTIKKKGIILGKYVLFRLDDVDLLENAKDICGVEKVYFAFRFSSSKDLATYIEQNAKAKPINFVFEEGSQEDLYRLIEDYLQISKNGRISEVEPKEVYKLFKMEGFYYLIQYEADGQGGFCKYKGERSVFVDGSYESYILAYKFICNGIDIDAIVPLYKDKNALRSILISLYVLSTSCQNRNINLYICSLDSNKKISDKIGFPNPVFIAGGDIFNNNIVSIPIELLYGIKVPKKVKTVKTKFELGNILNCKFDDGLRFTNLRKTSFNKIFDEILRKLSANSTQNLEQ